MEFRYNDGGRRAAGLGGPSGDCVVRAIAIASGRPYREVYCHLWALQSGLARTSGVALKSANPDRGVGRSIYHPYLMSIGFTWQPCMSIGSGCRVHLRADELPKGRLIVRLSKHLAAVIDGVLHDTYDCTRYGTRCVYGYFFLNSGQ